MFIRIVVYGCVILGWLLIRSTGILDDTSQWLIYPFVFFLGGLAAVVSETLIKIQEL